ncbi:thiol:disulfide interchange protein DsbA/DsbL [Permianibacter sp. IMCC34836]|uniref:thiol:disulfide interchange protein DsbA/DsbL n=1 Tax=Permianibacter fluminis TaxID=2738515 RepID=UPI0015566E14|nr:thiol:disulfide interchange protein DsbA/DsbL [Permianibacter fluminis]NQD36614.1 thiol:disulfide interchange protein DsbA/DsbL [Permianibacter fluminis]
MKFLAVVAAALFSVAAVAAPGDWKEGVHYKIAEPMGKTAEPTVVEVFSYGCPVCYGLDERIEAWKKTKPANVKFLRIPHYGIHDEGSWLIKMFYTAEALGISEQMHKPLFDLIHKDNGGHSPIRNENDAVAFLVKFGKPEAVVRETIKGFYVNTKVNVAKAFVQKFRVNSVPAFVINEKYYTDGTLAKADLFNVLSELPLK